MSRRKRISKWLACAGLFLCLLTVAVPVYAEEATTAAVTEATTEAETTTAPETTAETKAEPETKAPEEKEAKPAEEAKEDTETAALPKGNLTLVDDVISPSDANREFLTVASKDGSYFYIVIDRDSQGVGNVYFLNLVDNQDLYKLTGNSAASVTKTEESTQVVLEPQTQKTEEDAEQETELTEEEAAKQKQKSLYITVGVFAAIGVGVVIYVLKKKKSKQSAKSEFDLSDFDDDEE